MVAVGSAALDCASLDGEPFVSGGGERGGSLSGGDVTGDVSTEKVLCLVACVSLSLAAAVVLPAGWGLDVDAPCAAVAGGGVEGHQSVVERDGWAASSWCGHVRGLLMAVRHGTAYVAAVCSRMIPRMR